MVIDFGNGIRATTTIPDEDAPFAITNHEGVAYPELEISAIEAGVQNGGTIGGTRAKMRRMRFEFVHDKVMTTLEIKRLFSPDVERTVLSELGSMPYYVADVSFPKSDLRAKTKFALVILSEWAYPMSGPTTVYTEEPPSGGLSYPYSYPYSYGLLASDTALSLMSGVDVATPAQLTVSLAVPASSLTIDVNGRSATITGELLAADVVAIDTVTHTVTVNGTNRLAWLDRSSVWPVLDAWHNLITSSVMGGLIVEYSPCMMGLL